MSQINVRNLSNENDDGAPDIVGVSTFSATSYFVPPVGNTQQRPENPQEGDLRFNTDIASLEYFRGNGIGWEQVEMTSPDLGGGTGSNAGLGGRMLYGGAMPTPYTNTVDYLTISTTGNSVDFGDLTATKGSHGFGSSSTRGVMMGGYASSGGTNVLEYATFANIGNFIDFGDISTGWKNDANAASSQTRSVLGSGQNSDSSPYYTNMIDYITIAQTGNAVDFGDAPAAHQSRTACASSTRGIYINNSYNTDIQYITISTTGNTSDFGNMNYAGNFACAGSNSTRGIVSCGSVNNIEYITIATTGTSTDFGDKITGATFREVAGTDPTRCVLAGGRGYSGGYYQTNAIQYVQIMSTGNAVDFGDLVMITANGQEKSMGGSNSHGGL